MSDKIIATLEDNVKSCQKIMDTLIFLQNTAIVAIAPTTI